MVSRRGAESPGRRERFFLSFSASLREKRDESRTEETGWVSVGCEGGKAQIIKE